MCIDTKTIQRRYKRAGELVSAVEPLTCIHKMENRVTTVRFFVVGDIGKAGPGRSGVATAMAELQTRWRHCNEKLATFVITTGGLRHLSFAHFAFNLASILSLHPITLASIRHTPTKMMHAA